MYDCSFFLASFPIQNFVKMIEKIPFFKVECLFQNLQIRKENYFLPYFIYFVYFRAGFTDGPQKDIVPRVIFVFDVTHPAAIDLVVHTHKRVRPSLKLAMV